MGGLLGANLSSSATITTISVNLGGTGVSVGVGTGGVTVGGTVTSPIETTTPDPGETNTPPVETPDPGDIETPNPGEVEINSVVDRTVMKRLLRMGATVIVGSVINPDVVTRGDKGDLEGWHGDTAMIEPPGTPIRVQMPVFRMPGDLPMQK